jgi:Domain of unknown function (DUF4326)
MAERIQLRRTKGWRKPPNAVVVTRGTDWGNPYRVGDEVVVEAGPGGQKGATWYVYGTTITPQIAVLLFRLWVSDRLEMQIRDELAGRDLACWCPLGQPCHADVLLEVANGGAAWT